MQKRSGARRIGTAVLAVATVVMFAGCSLLIPEPAPTRDGESGEIIGGGQQSVFGVQVGDCWNDESEAEQVSEVPVVPCSEPHDNEVIALFDLPDGDFPGADEVEEAAVAGCLERFEDYVGIAYEESTLTLYEWWPSEGSWEHSNDREVVCSVWDVEGLLVGSVKGSAR